MTALSAAEAELERLEELDRACREATADAEQQTAGMREVALFRAANAKAVMGGFALGLARRHVELLRSTQPRPSAEPASTRFLIEGDWLVEDVGHHTCGTGPDGHYGAHERGCGLEPLISLDQLDQIMRARARFAARILPAEEHEECVAVQVLGGDALGLRRLQGELELPRDLAAALLLALGEPLPAELPEGQQPSPEPF